jgi:two-component system response regulator
MDNRTILLVEDNPDDELLTLDALASNNIHNPVVVARNGVEALDYVFCTGIYKDRDITDCPAIILLDLKLPKIDGLEVLRRIRADPRTRLYPVAILTSSDEDEDRINGYELGANSYVRKPVDFDEFVQAAGRLGLYWLLLNQPPTRPVGEV